MSTKKDYVMGSGNVFADLRVPVPKKRWPKRNSLTRLRR